MEYKIRCAERHDKAVIMDIYAYARKFMAEHGNPNQWKNNNPSEEIVNADISSGQLYVIYESGNEDAVHGVFYFHIGEDATYAVIEDGHWLSDETYGTIHRVASDGTVHGVLSLAVEFCGKKIKHLRIDTHKDNAIMQHVIEKNGFVKCGTIYVKDGTPRIAYEKM